MRANLNAHILSPHRPVAPSSRRTSTSGTGQSTTFQQVLQQQAGAPPSTAAAQPVRMAVTNLSIRDVSAYANGGLMSNPSGNNALNGGIIPYNPNYYATLEAATEVARQVGGTVVDLRGQISNNQAEYFIDLPNGTRINAGNLVAILNNPVYQENSRVMDGKVAELLNNNAVGSTNIGAGLYTVKDGQVSYQPAVQT